ncbi:MAG: cation:proton antiporter [Acidimicrobiales bacterium]
MLFTVGWLGVMLLLVSTGFETDLGLIRRLGGAAAWVSTGSLIVPMAAGLFVGWSIPSVFVGEETERYVFALFIAAALSISSLPVIAKILTEMGLMRRNFGQLTLAAGMANDVLGWLLLGFVAGLARGGLDIGKLAFTVVGLGVFFVFAFTVGKRLVDLSLRRVRLNGDDPVSGLVVVLVTALVFGVITQWLHVEAVLGAFVAGVVLARSRFAEHRLIAPVESVTTAFLAPVFFATAGLRVDLGLLADLETLAWALLVVAVASVSKFAGAWVGARFGQLSSREGAALGVGLNARGALEVVIATVGLSLGVLNERSYTIVVLMAMATSMLAPPLLRRVLRDFDGNAKERDRLDREAVLAANSVVTDKGVLLATRGGISSMLAAQVIATAWPEDTPVTLLTVGDHDVDLRPFRAVLAGHRVHHVVVEDGEHVADAITREALLGYGAIAMGAAVDADSGGVVSPLVDEVVMHAPVPVVVVRMQRTTVIVCRGPSPVQWCR